MSTMDKEKYSSEKITVKKLEGSADYAYWRHNARVYLTRYDTLLLGLQEEHNSTSNAAITKWGEASAQAKWQLIILLSEPVQFRAIELIDDYEKTVYDRGPFLESTYTASNGKAAQNLRVQLDQLVHADGTNCDQHLNKFNSLIAQLAV